MQYVFAYSVLILAGWKAGELFAWLIRKVKHKIRGRGGEINV